MKSSKFGIILLILAMIFMLQEIASAKPNTIVINEQTQIAFSQYDVYLNAISENQAVGLQKTLNAGLLTIELMLASWILRKSFSQWQCSIVY